MNNIPCNAVEAGVGTEGEVIYIGRAKLDGELHLAKICPKNGCAFVTSEGKENKTLDYEVK